MTQKGNEAGGSPSLGSRAGQDEKGLGLAALICLSRAITVYTFQTTKPARGDNDRRRHINGHRGDLKEGGRNEGGTQGEMK